MLQIEMGASYEGLKYYSRDILTLDVTSFTNQVLKSHVRHRLQTNRLSNRCYFCVPLVTNLDFCICGVVIVGPQFKGQAVFAQHPRSLKKWQIVCAKRH